MSEEAVVIPLLAADNSAGVGPWWVSPLIALASGLLGGVFGNMFIEWYRVRTQDKRETGKRARDAGDVLTRAAVDYESAVIYGSSEEVGQSLSELMREVAPHLPDLPRRFAALLIEVEQASQYAVVFRQEVDAQEDSPELLAALDHHVLQLALLLRAQVFRWRVGRTDDEIQSARYEVFERMKKIANLAGLELVAKEGQPFGPPEL
ncbi:hypothetical protein MED15_00601 [Micromonospora noduli]|uniref:Uncharacterized protein n=1 Tax=Micromonospora noduli TaxID=709876 RepID=A0ABX9DB54_9ACTN|nr:hypothetical protein [Micromonospora noduli]RAO24843.1 hypothetical protein MED15_00601 [Micromonospora noduli]